MNALSLFSGIGGIDLAGEWAGIKTVAFCEREPFPQSVLRKHWTGVPIYEDVCTLTKERLEADGIRAIDLIHGGYPCQPFSHAGKRQGKEDDRHLWPEVYRLLQEIRPRWFVGENVAGHVTLGLDDVLSDLGGIGYTSQSFIIPAAAVGAPHRRDRVFIVCYTSSQRLSEWRKSTISEKSQESGTREIHGPERSGKDVADTNSLRYLERESEKYATEKWEQSQSGPTFGNQDVGYTERLRCDWKPRWRSREVTENGYIGIQERNGAERSIESRLGGMLNGLSDWLDRYHWPSGQGSEQFNWEPPRVATGVKDRVGRLKALGNAVNPVQIYPILAAIKQIDDLLRDSAIESNEYA